MTHRVGGRGARILAGCAVVLAVLAGAPTEAAARPGAEPEVIHASLQFDGRERTYRLYVPSEFATPSAIPLVLALHGNGTDDDRFAELTQLETKAEEEGFLLVFPDAVQGIWNAGFSQKTTDVDDVGFLTALVDELASQYAVDTEQVFATGTSGGGMMTYLLGCDAPEVVAAIAPVAATMTVDCDPALPVGVLHIHGTDDPVIPIEGREERDLPPVAGVVEAWSGFDGCEATPAVTSEGPSTVTRWSECDSGTAVHFYAVDGMSHEYPQVADGDSIDAADISWTFFMEHARTDAAATATLTVQKSGKGKGKVTSSPVGITCGTDCAETYTSGTAVTLTVAPRAGSTFTGWAGGGCSGAVSSCTVMVSSDTLVTATFAKTAGAR